MVLDFHNSDEQLSINTATLLNNSAQIIGRVTGGNTIPAERAEVSVKVKVQRMNLRLSTL